jgi:glycogen operon protein
MWRTQQGNNNAYVQDNEISWLDWTPNPDADDMLALTRRLLALRRSHPVLRQSAFFEGHVLESGDGFSATKDLAWFHPAGRELNADDWFDTGLRSIGMYLDGRGIRHRTPRGESITDESFLLVLHSGDEPGTFVLPGAPWATEYVRVVDTEFPGGCPAAGADAVVAGGTELKLLARSVLLLQARRGPSA